MPTGVLSLTDGVEAGVHADSITYDNVIRLFFALNEEYRKNAVWMMNDNTALTLRLMKDEAGNSLWNQANDTVLGKPVVISNDMPDEEGTESSRLAEEAAKAVAKQENNVKLGLNEVSMRE